MLSQESRMREFTLRNQAQLPQAAGVAMAAYQSLADELRDNRNQQQRIQDAKEKLLEGLDEAATIAGAAKGVLATDTSAVPISKELADANERLIQAKKPRGMDEGLLRIFGVEAAKRLMRRRKGRGGPEGARSWATR